MNLKALTYYLQARNRDSPATPFSGKGDGAKGEVHFGDASSVGLNLTQGLLTEFQRIMLLFLHVTAVPGCVLMDVRISGFPFFKRTSPRSEDQRSLQSKRFLKTLLLPLARTKDKFFSHAHFLIASFLLATSSALSSHRLTLHPVSMFFTTYPLVSIF